VSLASSVCVSRQYSDEFKLLQDKALAVNPDASVENRLANILSLTKAKWLLEHMDNFFIMDSEDEEE
jgi:predicted anti-sigma-YlaC factor YlaD